MTNLVEMVNEDDIDLTYEFHDVLNPKLWDTSGNPLPQVQSQLCTIACEFISFLGVDDLAVVDVVLTGSSANYNWSQYSDVDIHIVVDAFHVVSEHGELATEFFHAKRALWSQTHDITCEGMPVELYVEMDNEPHQSTGIYSLYQHEWMVEPKPVSPTIDDIAVRKKTATWTNLIDALIRRSAPSDEVAKWADRLQAMRKAGLERGGEFSVENVTFKQLRNSGAIKRLRDYRDQAKAAELSS